MDIQLVGTGSILTDSLSACAVVDRNIMIDVPNGAIKSYRRLGLDPKDLDILLITHFHADHYFDVVFLLLELGLRQERQEEFLLCGPVGLRKQIDSLFSLAYPESYSKVLSNAKVRFLELADESDEFHYRNYVITPYQVDHRTPSALGYTVAATHVTVGFSGDTELCDGVEEILNRSQLAILDCSFLTPRSGHMGLSDLLRLQMEHPEVRIVPTHMSDEVRACVDSPFVIPQDGDIFSL